MGNNVQISKSLFNALYRYHVCNDTGDAVYIKDELKEKNESSYWKNHVWASKDRHNRRNTKYGNDGV